jgi:intracellular sulfur oxidation DsrE/DsrF family protein
MKKIAFFVFICLLSSLVFAQDKVVYHFDQAEVQALKGLRNIRNQLEAAPETKIIVVTHALGVDFLMQGARDQVSKSEYAPLISDLKAKGVVFEVCEFTIKNRGLTKDQFILEADFTPSGVVRVTRLQNKEGFAYLKP